MKDILLHLSMLVLISLGLMALDAIKTTNEGLVYYGWLVILFSAVIYAIFALRKLSKSKR